MPVEYEYAEGILGIDYVLKNSREEWQMAFEGGWYPYDNWKLYLCQIENVVFLKFRRQVSSTLEL